MATYYKAPTKDFVSTTLDGAIDDSVDTITLTSVANLQAPGYIVIDRQDGSGNDTPTLREVVPYTGISGSDLTGCTRGANNSTANGHADGALVETAPLVGMWNDLRDGVAASITTNGAGIHLTGTASISVLKLGTFLTDENLAITSVASVAYAELTQMALSSVASVNHVEYVRSTMALNSNSSGGVACNFATANLFSRVLQANTTIAFTGWGTGDKAVARLIQDGTGSRTVNWDPGSGATIAWAGGAAPTLTTTANKTDSYGFIAVSDVQLDGYIVGENI